MKKCIRTNLVVCGNGVVAAQRLQDLLLFVESTAAAAGAARSREELCARAPAINAWLHIHRNGLCKISLVERQTSFL